DLVDYSQERFNQISAEWRTFAHELGLDDITSIPASGLRGDNVVRRSGNAPWYEGPTLLEYLETVDIDGARLEAAPMRLPVQWVNRPDADFRGFAGQIVSGTVRPGDRVVIAPSGVESAIERIVTYTGDLDRAVAGQSVTVTLADEVDVSRGNLIVAADTPARLGEQFEATVVWM